MYNNLSSYIEEWVITYNNRKARRIESVNGIFLKIIKFL